MSMKKVVCLVFMDDYPWDVRVQKFITSLAGAGHAVHLVCRNLSGRPCHERTDHVTIHRLPCLKNKRLNYVANFPAFFNPFWIWRILRVVAQHKARLIIVRDIPLVLAARLAASIRRVPLIIDMAENYPAMTRHIWEYGTARVTDVFVRNPILVRLVEIMSIRLADHVFVVVEESKLRLALDGCRPEKISVLMNTPPMQTATKPRVDSGSNSLARGAGYVAMYVGGLEHGRGLDVVLRSVPAILRELPSFRLVIVGARGAEENLRAIATRLRINSSVVFTGWIPHREMLTLLQASDVCIIPHRPSAHTNTTIPNKLFEYMAAGKPVISSDLAPVRRVIEQEGCGLILRELSPAEIVKCLRRMSDPKTRTLIGEKGRQAVLRQYNWEASETRLLDVVGRFALRRSQRSVASAIR